MSPDRFLGHALLWLALIAVPLRAEGPTDLRGDTRAQRRAYAGAPPVIPHGELGMDCQQCHGALPVRLPDLGLSPASPHDRTLGLGRAARCLQCHLVRRSSDEFRPSGFAQGARPAQRGTKAHAFAPSTIPHRIFMRENCVACHAGERASADIRTGHPDRARCQQCHVPIQSSKVFVRQP
jgi:cytochrome c-type protein NapB